MRVVYVECVRGTWRIRLCYACGLRHVHDPADIVVPHSALPGGSHRVRDLAGSHVPRTVLPGGLLRVRQARRAIGRVSLRACANTLVLEGGLR